MTAPKDRRSAMKQQREKSREARLKVSEAMQTGDERYFPARDRGPVRKFARDYVDSRRTLGEFMLPLLMGILILMVVPIPAAQTLSIYLWLATIIAVPINLIGMSMGLSRGLRQKFPDESQRGVKMYAIMRSTQMRRLRLPKPQVKPGDKI